jgi:uncharacterized membrane protein YphA (DoxX/SURF4 family)
MPAMVALVENGSVALGLIAAIVISASVGATRRHVPTPGLRLLLIAVLTLYAVGCAAIVHGQLTPAVAAFAAGMIVCAFGAWLSRGSDKGEPPSGGEPFDRPPPRRPDCPPEIDWDRFERELRDWAGRHAPAHR